MWACDYDKEDDMLVLAPETEDNTPDPGANNKEGDEPGLATTKRRVMSWDRQ